MKKNRPLLLLTAALPFLLASCDSMPDWLGSKEKDKLPGERFAVMPGPVKIIANPDIQADTIDIPEALKTPSNGFSTGNFYTEGDLTSIQSTSIGDEPQEEFFLAFPPLVVDKTVYAIDGHSNISAYDADTLKHKWTRRSDAKKKNRDLPGGGLAEAYGVLYASTGYGDVVAVSTVDGALVWKKNLGAPLRRPPVIANDKVFAVTIDNQLFALSVVDGATLWRHSGVRENTSIYGSANVTVKNDVVIAAYSSGEIFGISALRGSELWTELASLTSDHESASGSLNDVSASPVIVDGIAYIGGNSGDLYAFNAANGSHIWQQSLGPINTTPWVADKYIFVIAQSNQLVALNRLDGRIKWVSELPTSRKVEKRNFWSGPVMAGGKLVIAGSKGKLLVVEPQSGKILKDNLKIPEGVYGTPAIANGKLYLLTRDAEMVVVK